MGIALFAGYFAVSLLFQISSGTWGSDFGGHSDEASHVVTSLMVRDYLAGGFLETPHPMRFAEDYYGRFPKVAIGHYPPGFYLLAAIFLLPFRAAQTFLVLLNLIGAATAVVIAGLGRRATGNAGIGAILGLLWLVLPQTRTYTAIVMADLLVVLFGLLAAGAFASFLEGRWRRDSLWFGLWAACAILTKGSAVGLALLPPVALLLSGRWRTVLDPRLWIAPVPVLLLALPWMVLTAGITGEGMQESSAMDWFKAALPYYGEALVIELGWVLIMGLSFGVAVTVKAGLSRRATMDPVEAVLWGLVSGGMVVPLLVPAGLDHRYLMPLVPCLILLAGAGVARSVAARPKRFRVVLVLVFSLVVVAETFRPVRKIYEGAGEAVRVVLKDAAGAGTSPRRLLAVSNARGEGALIAAAALQAPDRLKTERGYKLLSKSDWLGRGYEIAFEGPAEFLALLDEGSIQYVVIDPAYGDAIQEHWIKAMDTLNAGLEERVVRFAEVPARRRDLTGSFTVYRIEPAR